MNKKIVSILVLFLSVLSSVPSITEAKEWTKILGSSSQEAAVDATVDKKGNVYVTGYTMGDLGGNTNAGLIDAFTAKYDKKGNKIWVRLLGSDTYDYGQGIAVDTRGNVYVTGYTHGDLDGNTNAGTLGSDIFIAKYDKNGNKKWVKLLGSSFFDYGYGIALDKKGNAYVTGLTGGDIEGNTNVGKSDLFVAKYDKNGQKQWLIFLGSTENDTAYSIAVDPKGKNIFITGATEGDLDGNPNQGSWDAFVAKFNKKGKKVWLQPLATKEKEKGWGIGIDSKNNAYVTGHTVGDLEGNTNSGSGSDEFGDVFTAKFDKNGKKLWVKLLGTKEDDAAWGIAVNKKGDVFITGEAGADIVKQKHSGAGDVLFAKYNKNGQLKSIKLHGTNGYDTGKGIGVSPKGEVFIAGSTSGKNLGGAASVGNVDVFIWKQ